MMKCVDVCLWRVQCVIGCLQICHGMVYHVYVWTSQWVCYVYMVVAVHCMVCVLLFMCVKFVWCVVGLIEFVCGVCVCGGI